VTTVVEPPEFTETLLGEATLGVGDSLTVVAQSKYYSRKIRPDGSEDTLELTHARKTYTITLEELRYLGRGGLAILTAAEVKLTITCSDGTTGTIEDTVAYSKDFYYKKLRINVTVNLNNTITIKVYEQHAPQRPLQHENVAVTRFKYGYMALFPVETEPGEYSLAPVTQLELGYYIDFQLAGKRGTIAYYSSSGITLEYVTTEMAILHEEITFYVNVPGEVDTYIQVLVEYIATYDPNTSKWNIDFNGVKPKTYGVPGTDYNIVLVATEVTENPVTDLNQYIGNKSSYIVATVTSRESTSFDLENGIAALIALRPKWSGDTPPQPVLLPLVHTFTARIYNRWLSIEKEPFSAYNGYARIWLPKPLTPVYAYAYSRCNVGTFEATSPATKVTTGGDYNLVEYNTLSTEVYSKLDFCSSPDRNDSYFPHNPPDCNRSYLYPTVDENDPNLVELVVGFIVDASKPVSDIIRLEYRYHTYPTRMSQGVVCDPNNPSPGCNPVLRPDDGDLYRVEHEYRIRIAPPIWNNVYKDPEWKVLLVANLGKRSLTTGVARSLDDIPEAMAQLVLTVGNKMDYKITAVYVKVTVSDNLRIYTISETGEYVDNGTETSTGRETSIEPGRIEDVELPVYIKALKPGTGKITISGYILLESGLGYLVYTELDVDVKQATANIEFTIDKTELYPQTYSTITVTIENTGDSPIRQPVIEASVSGDIALVVSGVQQKNIKITLQAVAPGDKVEIPLLVAWDGNWTNYDENNNPLDEQASVTVTVSYSYESGDTGQASETFNLTLHPGPLVKPSITVSEPMTSCRDYASLKVSIANNGVVRADNVVVQVLLYLPETGRYVNLYQEEIASLEPSMSREIDVTVPATTANIYNVSVVVRYSLLDQLEENGYKLRDIMTAVNLSKPETLITYVLDPDTPTDLEYNSIEFIVYNPGDTTVTISYPDTVRIVGYYVDPAGTVTVDEDNRLVTVEFSEQASEYHIRLDYQLLMGSDVYKTLDWTITCGEAQCSLSTSGYRESLTPVVDIKIKANPPIVAPNQEATIVVEAELLSGAKAYLPDAEYRVVLQRGLEVSDPGDFEVESTTDPVTGDTIYSLKCSLGRLEQGNKYARSFKVKAGSEGVYTIIASLVGVQPTLDQGSLDVHLAPVYGTIRVYPAIDQLVVKQSSSTPDIVIRCYEEQVYEDTHLDQEEITELVDYDAFNLYCVVFNKSDKPLLHNILEVDVPEQLEVTGMDGISGRGPTTLKWFYQDIAPYGFEGSVSHFRLYVATIGVPGNATLTVRIRGKDPSGNEYTYEWSKTYTVSKGDVKLNIAYTIPYDPFIATDTPRKRLPVNVPVSILVSAVNSGKGYANNAVMRITLPMEARLVYSAVVLPRGIRKPVDNVTKLETGETLVEANLGQIPPPEKVADIYPPSIHLVFYWSGQEELVGSTKQIRVELVSDEDSTSYLIPITLEPPVKRSVQEILAYEPRRHRHYYDLKYVSIYAGAFHYIYSWIDPYTGGVWVYGKPKPTTYLQSRFGYNIEDTLDMYSKTGVTPRTGEIPKGYDADNYF